MYLQKDGRYVACIHKKNIQIFLDIKVKKYMSLTRVQHIKVKSYRYPRSKSESTILILAKNMTNGLTFAVIEL